MQVRVEQFLKTLSNWRSEVGVGFAYFFLLGWPSVPLTGDQKLYIWTAMEMQEAGVWIFPRLYGEMSPYKPPFHSWITMVSWNLLGFNLWATLLPSLLCLGACLWVLRKLSEELGVISERSQATLLFGTALGTMIFSTTAQMEMYIVFFYMAAIWLAIRWLTTGQARWIYFCFIVTGFSALVKSPLYPVFFTLGLGTYCVATGQWRKLFSFHLWMALLIGAAIGLAWYLAFYFQSPAQQGIIHRTQFLPLNIAYQFYP